MMTVIISAFYLGLLCSIAPCPLATNIAAVGFIGLKSGHEKDVIVPGICYAGGRLLAFILLGFLLTKVINFTPQASHFLQKYMKIALGPLLILVGMCLLEMIPTPLNRRSASNRFLQNVAVKSRVYGAFLLGVFFALSFCPTSAALFFGALLPLAIKHNMTLTLSGVFGIASGLPVILFAFLLAGSVGILNKIYTNITRIEIYLHRLTGFLFLLLGIYFTVTQTLTI